MKLIAFTSSLTVVVFNFCKDQYAFILKWFEKISIYEAHEEIFLLQVISRMPTSKLHLEFQY